MPGTTGLTIVKTIRAVPIIPILFGLMALPLAGCIKPFLQGEEKPLNKVIIKVNVPTDKPPQTVKPLDEPRPAEQPKPPVVKADERLMPTELPPQQLLAPQPIPMEPNRPRPAHAFGAPDNGRSGGSYENAVLTEDVTWSGTVTVRGSLVVAPQATLRVEPGTTVRFVRSPILKQLPRLVVQGRIHCAGSPDRPVVFEAGSGPEPAWSGILLLGSEKRNLLEHCRIERAEKGLEARFSTLTAKGMTFRECTTGFALHDTTATVAGIAAEGCETAILARDSELEIREGLLDRNRSGIVAAGSSLVLGGCVIRNATGVGLSAEECRIRLSGCELAANGTGAAIRGGEGQIISTRITGSRVAGLQLSGARLKVTRCRIGGNTGDGVVLDDGRPMLTGNVISDNGGHNMINRGGHDIAAPLNWWGTADEAAILAKVMDRRKNPAAGAIAVFPWLTEKPAAVQ